MSDFGNVLSAHLNGKGLSQAAFARDARTAQAFVSQVIRGVRTPPIDRLEGWASILQLGERDRAQFILLGLLAHCPAVLRDWVKSEKARADKAAEECDQLRGAVAALEYREQERDTGPLNQALMQCDALRAEVERLKGESRNHAVQVKILQGVRDAEKARADKAEDRAEAGDEAMATMRRQLDLEQDDDVNTALMRVMENLREGWSRADKMKADGERAVMEERNQTAKATAERDALRDEVELYKNGAACRAEERDAARAERDSFKLRLIEAEDGRAKMHAEVQRLSKEISEAKGYLQGDCASERGNQSLINAAREMMAVLERHRDGEDEARQQIEQAAALLHDARAVVAADVRSFSMPNSTRILRRLDDFLAAYRNGAVPEDDITLPHERDVLNKIVNDVAAILSRTTAAPHGGIVECVKAVVANMEREKARADKAAEECDQLRGAVAALEYREQERDTGPLNDALIERDALRAEVEQLKRELQKDWEANCCDLMADAQREKARAEKAAAERDRLAGLLGDIKHYFENQSAYGTQRLFDIRDRIDAALAEIGGGK